jgi:hypothetical protein
MNGDALSPEFFTVQGCSENIRRLPPRALRRVAILLIFTLSLSLVRSELKGITAFVVTDVFNHSADEFQLTRGKFSLLDIFSQQVAQNPPEVLMPWVDRNCASRSAYPRTGKAGQYRKGIHLALHAKLLIQEPPAGTKLHLPGMVPSL